MRTSYWSLFFSLAAFLWLNNANALAINDELHPGVLLTDGASHTETHNLSTYIPLDYLATSGMIVLGFTDDSANDAVEWVEWNISDITGQMEVGTHFQLQSFASAPLTFTALADINVDGLLDVTITVDDTTQFVNDVIWYTSILIVYADVVPEPSTLPLVLGSSLLGLAYLGHTNRKTRFELA